jgi:hypothetical protein
MHDDCFISPSDIEVPVPCAGCAKLSVTCYSTFVFMRVLVTVLALYFDRHCFGPHRILASSSSLAFCSGSSM